MEEFAGRRWRESAANLSFGAALMEEERRKRGHSTEREKERAERECRGRRGRGQVEEEGSHS